MKKKNAHKRTLFLWGGCIILFLFILAVGMIGEVHYSYRSSLYEEKSISDTYHVALVFGTSVLGKEPNHVLEDRLETALALYHDKKVEKLLLSGDNRRADYNEPMAMKTYLLGRGVPEKDLILDYAGRRTYDSCYRAKEIFNVSRALLVTQKFHLPRALYLCNILGVQSVGVISDKREYPQRFHWFNREIGASLRAWFDIHILRSEPLLGQKEPIE